MSDLAPFVAATLRDKVVSDMEQEIKELQRCLRQSQVVEIVGGTEDEEVVYFSGLLQNGKHQDRCRHFTVPLSKQSARPCSLAELANLRVRIGGIHKATLREIAHNGDMQLSRLDGENHKYMVFEGSCVKLEFFIRRWPKEQWEPLVDIGHILMGNNLLHNLKLASNQCPEAIVSFRCVTLLTAEISGMLQNLPEPTRSKLAQEQAIARKERHYRAYITENLRRHGYEGRLAICSGEIVEVLQDFNVFGATTEREQTMIDLVVRLHKESQDASNPSEAFYESVRRIPSHF